MTSREERVSERTEPLKRLVASMVGQENTAASLPLATTIVSSSLGSTGRRAAGMGTVWRNVERRLIPNEYKELRKVHQDMASNHEGGTPLANGLVQVLGQLAGSDHADKTESTTVRNSERPSNDPKQDATTLPMDLSNLDLDRTARLVQSEERLLLRDCKFALQGIDGEKLRLSQDDVFIHPHSRIVLQESCHPIIPSRLGTGAAEAIRQCCQAGILYRSVQEYIAETTRRPNKGAVAQALARALRRELNDYHALLAGDKVASCESLRRLLVNMRQPIRRLQILAMLTDGLKDLSGGYLLTGLYKHSHHGDTRHRTLVETLLTAASRPWFHTLYLFTTQGNLLDPHDEFYVVLSENSNEALHWHERYLFRPEKIPVGILDESLALHCLKLGRGINFIRTTLQDTEWSMDLLTKSIGKGNTQQDVTSDGMEKEDSFRDALGYRYLPHSSELHSTGSRLDQTLTRASNQVHSYILKSLREEHHLMEHLWALKQFLLLGQGDFFSALFDGLCATFDGRAGLAGIYKHSLMSQVESALASTNAARLPSYVLASLSVDLSWEEDDDARYQFAPPRGSTSHTRDRSGWDIFMLSYDIPDTLKVVVHPASMKQYQTIFSLLFHLKHVEFTLNSTFRQSTALQHELQTYVQHNGINVLTNSEYSVALVFLREISITRQSMMHFTDNLKSYFMFEVLEVGWKELVAGVEKARTIDEVIATHDSYLESIFRKSMLGEPSATVENMEGAISSKIERLMTLAREFCGLQEDYFREALKAAERATLRRQEAEKRAEQGQWGFDSERELYEEETFFGLTEAIKMSRVSRIANEFSEKIGELLDQLNQIVDGPRPTTEGAGESLLSPLTPATVSSHETPLQRQHDHDSLRFLAFQLDFSDFYRTKR